MKLLNKNIDKGYVKIGLLAILIALGTYLSIMRGGSMNTLELRQYYQEYMKKSDK